MILRPRLTRDAGDGGAAWDMERAAAAQENAAQDGAHAAVSPSDAARGASHAADAQSSIAQDAAYATSAPFDSAQAAARPAPTEAPPISRHSVETYATERPAELYGRRRVVRDRRMPAASEKPIPIPSTSPSAEHYGIPDNPFAPQGEGQPRRRSRVARAQNAEAFAAQSADSTASPLAREQGISPRAPQSGAGAVSHAPSNGYRADNQPIHSTNRQAFAPQVSGASASTGTPSDALFPTGRPSFAPQESFQPSGAPAAPAQAQVFVTQDGSQFEAPVRPEVPDWLRVAQQNNLPLRRPQGPRVTAATRQSNDAATQRDPLGRPPHRPARHTGAGASPAPASPLTPANLQQRARSYAQAPSDAPRAPSQADNSPPAPFQRAARPRPTSGESPAPARRPRLVWMVAAVFLAAAVAVGLWLAQLSFRGQTQGVLDARQAAYDAVVEAHPLRYQSLIEEKAGKYNLSPAFVAAIVLNESSFRPDATSSVGARGLMQLVDKTASWVHGKLELPTPYSFDALYEPETNVEYGCWYLSFLCNRFRGDPILVAAAYHAGQGEVQNWLNDSRYSADNLTIELENMMDGPTKQYTARVVSDYAVYKRLYYPSTEDMP